MLEYVKDRQEELILLDWCIGMAKANKELIEALEAHVDIIKKNGEVHKGKQRMKLKLIKDLKKELKDMKTFYIKRRDEPSEWSTSRYSFNRRVNEGRKHLHTGENNDVDERVCNT